MRQAVSITLARDNILWLKAQAAASVKGTVSDVVDRLVTDARTQGRSEAAAITSVRDTIDLPEDDPDLERADTYVREILGRSLRRPVMVRERPSRAAPGRAARSRSKKRPRRG
jgi:hypothetical protein